MWTKYFKVIKIIPGPVITQRFGMIDLSRPDLSPDTLLELYENDFPYLALTPEGKLHFYGIQPDNNTDLDSKSSLTLNPENGLPMPADARTNSPGHAAANAASGSRANADNPFYEEAQHNEIAADPITGLPGATDAAIQPDMSNGNTLKQNAVTKGNADFVSKETLNSANTSNAKSASMPRAGKPITKRRKQ